MPYTSAPNDSWNVLFYKVREQGKSFDKPISPGNYYYAFLSKADYDESTDTWSIMFEVQTKEWTDNVFNNGSTEVMWIAPEVPASIYNITYVYTNPLLSVLGLKDSNEVAEASWYLITLIKQETGDVNGILYNPDIDMNPDDPAMFYGNYELTSASLLVVPILPDVYTPNVQLLQSVVDTGLAPEKIKKALSTRFYPYMKKQAYKRPRTEEKFDQLTFTAPVTSIGAMDIGQGNCNLLIDNATEPFLYFDVGYPLWFYVGSLPANMRFGTVGYQGPIVQNAAGNLGVVLSHWDWDHWRLGRIAGMQGLAWLVPFQPIGGSTLNFALTLANCTIHGGAPLNVLGGCTVYRCIPAFGTPPAAFMNNSGLAMLVNMQFPTTSPVATTVMMTGDANFNNVTGGPFLTLSCIEATHHGSNAHGAAANLPPQVPAYNNAGCVFYSYGMRPTGGGISYVYGFPVMAAVNAYRAAGWGNVGWGGVEVSTAEGGQIRALPATLANRGNVRVGDGTALPVIYNGSAFYNFAYVVN